MAVVRHEAAQVVELAKRVLDHASSATGLVLTRLHLFCSIGALICLSLVKCLRLGNRVGDVVEVSGATRRARGQVNAVRADTVDVCRMLATSNLFDQLALNDGIGVHEGAAGNRHVHLRTVLREGEPCNRFFAIASVDGVVFYLSLAHNGEILRDRHNIDLPRALGILEDQSQLATLGRDMRANLSLSLTRLKALDRVLCYDFASVEALREVEHFDRVGEDDHDPVLQDVQVDNLHVRAELDRANHLPDFVVPEAEARGWILNMGASTDEEKDVRVFVRVAQSRAAWDARSDLGFARGCLADLEAVGPSHDEVPILIDELH